MQYQHREERKGEKKKERERERGNLPKTNAPNPCSVFRYTDEWLFW
jgi:hypothetical protein